MSATTPTAPPVAPDTVNIEIDGVAMVAPKGSMIIHASDKAGIPIPRFCYHEKLPIAANCRMCLVDVEKMPKPAPACATPVMEGMKVYTRTRRALDAQRNVMEFLLVNHPLDCPICDQGGECELQDVSMGYGRSVSRYVDRKRVIADEDMGPLVATDMTRCIQCTRCVRFTADVAGTFELGGMSRGEKLQIGTYDGKPLMSELSGNVIDVCPVGALTNKPFRFKARAWELVARDSIGYHDALGSNLHLHIHRGQVVRTVPRDNEAVNECWLSDRDRYSHEGLYAPTARRSRWCARARPSAKWNGKRRCRWPPRCCAAPARTSASWSIRRRRTRRARCFPRSPPRSAPAASTTACSSSISATAPPPRCSRCPRRKWKRPRRCCSSAATCATNCRCCTSACSRPASAARRSTR
jgi:NADH dehydrogenase/NADH:ubiquinone oxidoreductase subunit G